MVTPRIQNRTETVFVLSHQTSQAIRYRQRLSLSPFPLALESFRQNGVHASRNPKTYRDQTTSHASYARTFPLRRREKSHPRTKHRQRIQRASTMAMVSPRLQHDIDRGVRAVYSLDPDRGLCGDAHRSSSVPAALRHHRRREESDRAVTAPVGYRGSRGSAARARLMSPTKHARTARSESPVMQCGPEQRAGERSPLKIQPRAAATAFDVEAPLTSEDSLGGTGAGGHFLKGNPVMTADVPERAESQERAGEPRIDFGASKLMELMEERDRAVHLCLQVRGTLGHTQPEHVDLLRLSGVKMKTSRGIVYTCFDTGQISC